MGSLMQRLDFAAATLKRDAMLESYSRRGWDTPQAVPWYLQFPMRGELMRIFLDDERPTPEGWVRAFWSCVNGRSGSLPRRRERGGVHCAVLSCAAQARGVLPCTPARRVKLYFTPGTAEPVYPDGTRG
jgi:hypothetical protein